jgi:predicted PurR-regulated permease PerM
VTKLAKEIHTTLGRYVRGQLIAIAVLSVFYSAGLKLVGVRLAIPIGVLTGCLSFVPYLGLTVGTSMAAVMALLDWQGSGHLAVVVGVMMVIGLLDGMVITPRIVGGSVGLKPIEVLLTMMGAATIVGFFGVLLAVPIGAVLKILIGHVVDAYLASTFYKEPPSVLTTSVPPAPTPLRPSLQPVPQQAPSIAPQSS